MTTFPPAPPTTTTTNPSTHQSTYIDFPALTTPTFRPQHHANTLIHSTNNASDTPVDLSTPLSRALFDAQELDTRLDALLTQHALPLTSHTATRAGAGTRVLDGVEEGVKGLNERFRRLEREVGERYGEAEEVRVVAERLVAVLRVGRRVGRVAGLGRAVEGYVEAGDLVSGARTVGELRGVWEEDKRDGGALGRVGVAEQIRSEVWAPAERRMLAKAQVVVREFSLSGLAASSQQQHQQQQPQQSQQEHSPANQPTFAQTESTKHRTTAALQTLYLLSPSPSDPTHLLTALTAYMQSAHTTSLAALTRALATLPTLERTLLEVSAHCQNIVALEKLLASTAAPTSASASAANTTTGPATATSAPPPTLLLPLLTHLETSSLPSHFWRTLSAPLSSRVKEILGRGGVSARTLRTNAERVRGMVRECVARGSRLPEGMVGGGGEGAEGETGGVKGWEREAAVMVGAVGGALGR